MGDVKTKTFFQAFGISLLIYAVAAIAVIAANSASLPSPGAKKRAEIEKRDADYRASKILWSVSGSTGMPMPEEPVVSWWEYLLLYFAFTVVAAIMYLALLIMMLAWVSRDARRRGAEGGVWVIVLLLLGLILPLVGMAAGLIVYLLSRPPFPATAAQS